jgi:methylated-DNA-[protein]-cysteine S-methyltransferase
MTTNNDAALLRGALAEVTAAELTALRGALAEVTETELTALHDRLAERAAADGVLDIAYRTLDTPVGTLLLAATGAGLVRVAFPIEGHDRVLQALATQISPRVLRAPGRLDTAAHEIDEYFTGRRRTFDLPLDYRLSSGFRRAVLTHLPAIGYGQTASYAALAVAVGSPRAYRAVGTACATNPLPVVLPCHRVVKSDGRAGSYRGGPAAKQFLLDMEAA